MAKLNHAEIAARVPHSGSMCLLDAVIDWNAESIRCHAINHRDATHPLRESASQVLDAVSAIEYAAQAMAVHGGLLAELATANKGPKIGYLASVRDVVLHCESLDHLRSPLVIEATRLMGDESRVMYEFNVSAGDHAYVSGRAAVVMDAGVNLGTTTK